MFRSRLRLLIVQKESRERRNITQDEIAQESGLSRATINRWMSYGDMPRLDAQSTAALCRYLECELSDLIELDPVMA